MLNSFWSCRWYLITDKNRYFYSKALAKQEEPKQLLGCPKNGCCFFKLPTFGLWLVVRLHQNVLADRTWICHYNKMFAVILAYICSICLGFQGRKKYFITQLKQIIQISEIFWSHCDCMLRACRKGIKVIFETVLFLEWTLSSKYMTSHLGLKL